MSRRATDSCQGYDCMGPAWPTHEADLPPVQQRRFGLHLGQFRNDIAHVVLGDELQQDARRALLEGPSLGRPPQC